MKSPELGSITYLDSENLFHGLGDRVKPAFQALYQWCDSNAAAPRQHRSYGKFHDPRQAQISEISNLLKTAMIYVGIGRDKADNQLLRDMGTGDAREFLVGSGDLKLLKGATAIKRISRVIVPPHANLASVRKAVPGALMLKLRDLYREKITEQSRRAWPAGRSGDQILPKWGDLINPDIRLTNPAWSDWALSCLRARGWSEQQASELVTVLTRWLTEVIPSHHHDRDFIADVEAKEAWRWYCMAAVAAAAIEPGTSDRHISSILFRAYSREDSDWWNKARARAKQVVTKSWSAVGDREEYLLLSLNKRFRGGDQV